MRQWWGMHSQPQTRRRSARILLAASLFISAAIGIASSAPAANAATAPNGLPWAIALDCGTTEPFWDVTVAVDGMWLREFDGGWTKLATQPSTPKNALRTWKVYHPDGRTGRFTLFDGPGSDGMSDRSYTYRLTVDLGGVRNEGGCDRLPDSSRPARVVNVADNDVLYIRSAPEATASSVATVAPGGIVWVRPVNEKRGWVPVASVFGAESGPATLATGWANGRFLGRRR